MRKKNWGVPALVGVCLLLFLALSASLLGAAYASVRVVPTVSGDRSVSDAGVLGADSAAYWLRVELEPEELYDLALRQTVRVSWEEKNEAGETVGSIAGTGIVASQDGYILTNSHIIIDAKNAGETVKVEFYDGRTFEGAVLGADPETEVGLLKIEAQGLSAATLGSSKDLVPCQTVYAMGHPSDALAFTITSGIISGLDRTVPFSDGTVLHMFQLDAAINPGNSGGPVYDILGNVVGIVTAKYIALNTEGIGFALPMDDVLPIAEELKTYGYVTGRPLFGIIVQSAEKDQFSEGSPAGALIYSVEEGLSGDRAGLIAGDIIVGINDRTVTDNNSLGEAKREFRAGDTVTIRIWRDGEYLEKELTFDEVTPEHPVGPVEIEEPEEAGSEEAPEGEPETAPEESEPGAETES